MATEEIKLNYPLAEAMVKTFEKGTEDLQDISQEIQSIANFIEEGGLEGRAGAAFVDGLRTQLTPALARLIDKFKELTDDVNQAMAFMRESDTSSAQKF